MRVVIIGAGKLGCPLAKALLESGVCAAGDLLIMQRSAARADQVRRETGVEALISPPRTLAGYDIVILSVKPQDLDAAAEMYRNLLSSRHLLISTLAGVPISRLMASFPEVHKVIRCMPNLPVQIRKGITVFASGQKISAADREQVIRIFSACGLALEVSDESLMDGATAVSGTGPGYVFAFIEALLASSMDCGFSREESEQLVGQTIEGAVALWRADPSQLTELSRKVASKNGTTEAAYRVLEQRGFKDAISAAVKAALVRSHELGKSKA